MPFYMQNYVSMHSLEYIVDLSYMDQ